MRMTSSNNFAILVLLVLSYNVSDGFIVKTKSLRQNVGTTVLATTAQLKNTELLTEQQIFASQRDAELNARANTNVRTWNALFLSVPERPTPIMCSPKDDHVGDEWMSLLHGNNNQLPSDFPPGSLLRLGPNGGPPEDGFLDGDGMVHCITFPPHREDAIGGSRIPNHMYSSTYITTQGRKLEKEWNQQFKGSLGSAPRGLPLVANLIRNIFTFRTLIGQKDTANTALAEHNGRVLALMEQSRPTEISIDKSGRMQTIESMTSLDGAIPFNDPLTGGSLSAHGRTCPDSGDRIHVSYTASAPPYVRVDTFGSDFPSSSSNEEITRANESRGWNLKHSVPVDLPNGVPAMVHDSAITENFVIVLDFPLTIRPARMLADRFPVEYEPQNGARIGLVPRNNANQNSIDGTATPRWFDCQPGVVLHSINAYEMKDAKKVVLHALRSEPRGDESFIQAYAATFLHEWILDLSTGIVSERCLNPSTLVDFPVMDNTKVGKVSDAVYCIAVSAICNGLKVRRYGRLRIRRFLIGILGTTNMLKFEFRFLGL
jgi:carotenoid cleavage dioxygenase-like enzyme